MRNQKMTFHLKHFAFSRFRHTIISISYFMLFPKLIQNNNLVMISNVMKRRGNVNYFETKKKKTCKKEKLQLLIYLAVKNKMPKV